MLYPGYLFIPILRQLLLETFHHVVITTQRQFVYLCPPLSAARDSFIQQCELEMFLLFQGVDGPIGAMGPQGARGVKVGGHFIFLDI